MWARGRPITPAATRAETERIAMALGLLGPRTPFVGDLAVVLRFKRARRTRVDVDNLTKLALDAGNGILWKDDSQIYRLDAEKILGVGTAAASTTIRVYRPTPASTGRLV